MGGWTETRPVSLGLLPSGPDPVGEWCVHRQPPSIYLDRPGEFRNRLERSSQAAAGKSGARPQGIRRGMGIRGSIKTKLSCIPQPGGDPVMGSLRGKACRKSSFAAAALRLRRMEPWRERDPCGGGIQRREDHIHHPRQTVFHRRTNGPSAPAGNANGVN